MPRKELTAPAKTYYNSSSRYYCPVCNAEIDMMNTPNGGRKDCKCGAHVYKHFEDKGTFFSNLMGANKKTGYTSTWVETDSRGRITAYLIK